MKQETAPGRSFVDVCCELGIEDYAERIFSSSSHGELFHLVGYVCMADAKPDPAAFRKWFLECVAEAERTWRRPESVYQHIAAAFFGMQEKEQGDQMKQETIITFEPSDDVEPEFACRRFRLAADKGLTADVACDRCSFRPIGEVLAPDSELTKACKRAGSSCLGAGRYYEPVEA